MLGWESRPRTAGGGWSEESLSDLADALGSIGFDYREPALAGIARWTARGLTAYDAAYVALAEAEAVPLVTDDAGVIAAAPDIAVALADWTEDG